MKKAFCLFMMTITVVCLHSQQYIDLDFSGIQGLNPQTVHVTNITKGTNVSLLGSEILRLNMLTTNVQPLGSEQYDLVIAPNPMRQSCSFSFYTKEVGLVSIRLYTIDGKTVYNSAKVLGKGNHQFSLTGVPVGIYLLTIQTSDRTKTARLISGGESGSVINLQSGSDDLDQMEYDARMKIPYSQKTVEMAYSRGDELKFIGVVQGLLSDTLYLSPVDNQTITFSFLADDEVYNPITGKIWMDRNLGAMHVASSSTDTVSFGDLYQWGRSLDGHEKVWSSLTGSLSNSDSVGHGDFIVALSSPFDWRSPQNNKLWQGVSGINNPCPAGFRLPTAREWNAERMTWSSNDAAGAFASPLKLPLAGSRSGNDTLNFIGGEGYYWSASVVESKAGFLNIYDSGASILSLERANGLSVRCVREDSVILNKQSTIPANGLIAWYKLDNSASDAGPNGLHGTASNTTTTTDRFGVADKALSFNGTSSYVVVADNNLLETNAVKSAFAWVKYEDKGGVSQAANVLYKYKQNSPHEDGYSLHFRTNGGTYNYGVTVKSSSNSQSSVFETVAIPGEWSLVGFVVENNRAKLYINGNLIGVGSQFSNEIFNGNARSLYIGYGQDGPYAFKGAIDDVCLYDRTFSDQEVFDLYNSNLPSVNVRPPTTSTSDVSVINSNSATLTGEVSGDGGAEVTSRGIVYSITSGFSTEDGIWVAATTNGTGSFTVLVSGLSSSTTYYYRAYATNSEGTSYGEEQSFTTSSSESGEWVRDNTTAVVDVTNPATGKTWMDRNLGASRAATSSTDAEAYGDLYQWGRAADGHEKRNSATTRTLSNSDTPGHGSFILGSPGTRYDWRNPQNDNLWQGVNGINNPCPNGYRLPTRAELEAELASWSSENAAGAFNSPLKLPVAGYRTDQTGSLSYVGSDGLYWSSTIVTTYSSYLYFVSSTAGAHAFAQRAYCYSVRCIKD
jgi:uncharacterized protein (TIGR02145 family)